MACANGFTNIAKALIDAGAVRSPCSHSPVLVCCLPLCTPLQLSGCRGLLRAKHMTRRSSSATDVQALHLMQDVSIVNAEGNTSLHWAACNGQCDAMRLLMMHGASASALNKCARARTLTAVQLLCGMLSLPHINFWQYQKRCQKLLCSVESSMCKVQSTTVDADSPRWWRTCPVGIAEWWLQAQAAVMICSCYKHQAQEPAGRRGIRAGGPASMGCCEQPLGQYRNTCMP